MTIETVVAGAVQVIGGVVVAPFLVGLTQLLKARLQGRRGPSPIQPYRELRRLWGKSGVDVVGTTVIYRLVPVVVVAAIGAAVLLVPAAVGAPGFGVGHDALTLAGLLGLARIAICVAAWDLSNGFSLQGASRDLMFAVFVEVTLVLCVVVAALVAGTTDLRGIIAGTAGIDPWASPVLILGAVAFAVVVIHEGPLLEYAGRDQALLQWAMAARHWLVLVIATQIFLPHPEGIWWQLGLLPVWLVVLCGALALTETLVAKMRVLLVPRLIGASAGVAFVGVIIWLSGAA